MVMNKNNNKGALIGGLLSGGPKQQQQQQQPLSFTTSTPTESQSPLALFPFTTHPNRLPLSLNPNTAKNRFVGSFLGHFWPYKPVFGDFRGLCLLWIVHFLDMDGGQTSWIARCYADAGREIPEFAGEGHQENTLVSMDSILPDDLLERILSYLPIASIFRASSVCKRWKEIVRSRRFLWNFSSVLSQKPWYFMFTSCDEPMGYAYDPLLRKWYSIDLPCLETSNWFIASSFGLVCFMDNDSGSRLFVCNPITKEYRRLEEPQGLKSSDYSALAVSVDRKSHNYTVAIVKSKQVPGNFFQWDLSIQVYDSETALWMTSVTEVFTGWRAGDESVICDGILYFLIYSTGGGMVVPDNRHGLIMYNLSSAYSHGSLIRTFIPVPCSLTCGRLMNLNGKLVMVGGIGKHDRSDIIKGIGIWILNGTQWIEVCRMPHKLFQGFGELDDVFSSRGTDDLIYIHSYGSPALLVFDMNKRHWKWSQKCPVTKKFPLQLFTGFCFEPRLEVTP